MINNNQNYDHHGFDRRTADQMVDGLADLVRQRVDAGFEPSLLSLMFARLPGSPTAVVGQMRDEVTRVFSTFITRVERNPTRFAAPLPILVAAPDTPVRKRHRQAVHDVALNGGAHVHAVLLVPPASRLRMTAEEHFRLNQELYLGDRSRIVRLDVRPVTHSPERVLDYVLKSVRRGRFALDDVLILPRAVSELR